MNQGGIRVLHVDDDERFGALAASFLGRLGSFDVTTRTGYESAMTAVDEESFDCVVCDYDLGAYDGLDVLDAVRERDPEVPFVLFTAKGSEQVASDAIAADATDYLQKGSGGRSQFELLANRVESAVGEARTRERLRSNRRRVRHLHEVAPEFAQCTSAAAVHRTTVSAAERILDFEWVFVAVPVDGQFESRPREHEGAFMLEEPFALDEGIVGETFQSGEPHVVDDLRAEPLATPADDQFRSGLSVPVGEQAVLQAVSDRTGAFDEYDREHAELLASHAAAALSRIESEQLYRTLVEQSHDGIYVYQGSSFQFVNDRVAELTGYAKADLYEMDLWSLVHEDDRENVKESARGAEDGPVVREARIVRKDGTVRHMALSTAQITYDGEPAFMGAARDVTERKRHERQLERTNERLEQFASVVSHDLKNPLAVAEGNLEMARETGDDEHLESASEALDRMSTLVTDVLALAREGSTVVDPDGVFLSSVASAAWTVVDTGDASFVLDDDAHVRADENRLKRLLENCFRNAVEHGTADGSVTVTVGALEDETGFYVADDGPGIPEGEREAVFESGVTNSPDGTGFGLAIVAEIADAHEWRVGATESEDGGARIEVADVEPVADARADADAVADDA
ncbi:PAS domain S-box protein [Halorubellus sp. JP-L1]|uniref:PAS domain S-box protein n=1 Tax=Halorubellus sp. JP-L1 TaxID=2715753 RepID=UPI001409ED79|nr:PAS domain S-box protein [Halorubellus sp. JP-L1]